MNPLSPLATRPGLLSVGSVAIEWVSFLHCDHTILREKMLILFYNEPELVIYFVCNVRRWRRVLDSRPGLWDEDLDLSNVGQLLRCRVERGTSLADPGL